MPRQNRIEQLIHRGCATFLQHLENQGRLVFFHPPNGGARSKTEAAIFKGLGVKAGVSDLIVIIPPAARLGAIEVKAPGGKTTKNQDAFLDQVRKMGGVTAMVESIDECVDVVYEWLAE